MKKNLQLLIMVHHDFVSVVYCFYEWFTRPQRVALLLSTLVTLMAVEATVFSTIMFKVRSVRRMLPECERHRKFDHNGEAAVGKVVVCTSRQSTVA